MNSPRKTERRIDRPDRGVVAPVVPTAGGLNRVRPIGVLRSRISDGVWAARRETNHQVTLPHGAAQLEAAGNLTNFRLAAGGGGSYAGGNDDSGTTAPFLDSDVYKWLEAVGWELSQRPDATLLAQAKGMIELIAAAQRPDGYLDTFFQVLHPGKEFTDLAWGHEMYVAGHLVQAAVAWKRGLDDDRLLRIAERSVDRIYEEAGPGRRELVCGHPELEMALVELYRLTANARPLELARVLVERRGHGLLGAGRYGSHYWQDHEPVRTAAEPTGHAVRQMYLDCGVVDVAVESADRELLDAVIRRWNNLVATRTYLTGSLGAHHRDEAIGDPFELPPDRAYGETCASIGSVMLAWRLLLATGESRYADLIERTAYNAVMSGLAFDGTHFFYSNPLMRRSCGVEVLEGAGSTRRATWFPVSCCPPNLMRFLACWPDMIATVDDGGIQIHQFASGEFEASVMGGVVRVATTTAYPWEGSIEITIRETIAEPWTLSIRVPAWCASASATLENPADSEASEASEHVVSSGPGNLRISRSWQAGDRIRVEMEMAPRVVVPDPRIDAVRGTIALERGPLVYALEDADLPAGRSVEAVEVAQWPDLRVLADSAPGLGDLRWLELEAEIRNDPAAAGWPYGAGPAAHVPADKMVIRAVPYFAWGNRAGLGMRVWVPTAKVREGTD